MRDSWRAWARMFVVVMWAATVGAQPPEPVEPLEVQASRHAAAWLAGDESARGRLQKLGPAVLPKIESLFTKESDATRLEGLARSWVREALDRAMRDQAGLIYHGQFAALKPLGHRGATVLLQIFRDEDERRELRRRAAMAMGDIGDRSILPRLRETMADFLSEGWVQQDAGFLMARLGDRSFVDRRIADAKEVAVRPATTANLPVLVAAHTTLAEVYYRTGDYDGAIKHYRQKMTILGELRGHVRPELTAGIDEEIALLNYNMACSLSLAGKIEPSYQALRRAIPHAAITIDMVKADGDLRGLRGDERYAGWLTDLEKLEEDATRARPGIPPDRQ